ncbi:UTP--glucose-1-phosphate uridylyltransferase [Paenibacillus selenitireducens]|uniref:UTP--glucose-1-phosphate uridylyltransferase n=1 Tax=Paenibacillus selenitireducens TaxID=1324314 RepID=A0A1T2XBY6_9BACL|nr:UTP--glucose-1-phosphate uridylyltransferase GalU [Paenibacillus selenitireducens]OPA77417.1 UTP--glucose-1-phosphate uridylyltransferase [Paenibacillus selenitireducens]
MKIRKAIIPAAGYGTRFLPATKAMPKEMLPIIDKPTIQFIIEEAVASGIEEILIVTSKGKMVIEDHFDSALDLEFYLEQKGNFEQLRKVREFIGIADIHYIRQSERKGLGHAIWVGRKFIGEEPFAVLLGDTFFEADPPALKQLIAGFDRFQTSILGVQTVEADAVSSYGIVDAKPLNEKFSYVDRLVEKPTVEESPSRLAMLGRYILTPSIFDILEHQPPGVGGEIQLTDALNQLLTKQAVFTCEVNGRWHDVGDPLGYVKAILAMTGLREDLKRRLRDEMIKLLGENKEPL